MATQAQRAAQAEFKPDSLYLKGQKKKIVDFIEAYGKISPMDAIKSFGCTKLATRIGEIERRCGFSFNRTKETNGTARWVSYSFCAGVDPSVYRIPSSEKIARILKKYSADN